MRYKLAFIPSDGIDYYSPPEFYVEFYSEFGSVSTIFTSVDELATVVRDSLTTADEEFFDSVTKFEKYAASNNVIHFALADNWYIISEACSVFNYDVFIEGIDTFKRKIRRQVYSSVKTTLDTKQ